jgi:Domain of unknown function (DUF4340)
MIMTKRQLGILAALTFICSLAVAFLSPTATKQLATDRRGERVMPILLTRANDIARLHMRTGKLTMDIDKKGDGFIDKDSGFPIKIDTLRDVISGTAALTFEEARSNDPSRYSDMALADEGELGTTGRDVTFLSQDGTEIARIILGSYEATLAGAQGGMYIRLPTGNQTWLARGSVRLPIERRDWFDVALIHLQRDDATTITLNPTDGRGYSLKREGKDLKLQNLPDGLTANDAKISQLNMMVEMLSFEDVRKAAPLPAKVTRFSVTTASGLNYSLILLGDGWVHVEASATSDGGTEAAKAIMAKTSGFDFKLPSYETGLLAWRLNDVTTNTKG